jgi:hypothetical protein
MFAYSIINFHELTPGNGCNVIANKFHSPIQHLTEQVMTYFHLEKQEDSNAAVAADLQQLLFGKYKLCMGDMFLAEQLLQQWIYVAQNILYPAAIPGHTINITQHDINNVTID